MTTMSRRRIGAMSAGMLLVSLGPEAAVKARKAGKTKTKVHGWVLLRSLSRALDDTKVDASFEVVAHDGETARDWLFTTTWSFSASKKEVKKEIVARAKVFTINQLKRETGTTYESKEIRINLVGF